MKKVFKLEDLDCANCAQKMERGIRKIEGCRGLYGKLYVAENDSNS